MNIETAVTVAAILGVIALAWGVVKLLKCWLFQCIIAIQLLAVAATPLFWLFIYTRYFEGDAIALKFIKEGVCTTLVAIGFGFIVTMICSIANDEKEKKARETQEGDSEQ